MAAPTPWQARRAIAKPTPRAQFTDRLRDGWPYAVAAAGSVAIFLIEFRIWMIAPDRDGSNSVDAFGTTYTATAHLNLWSQQPPPGAAVSGIWGIFTAIAAFVTVFAAAQAIYRGTRTPAVVTSGAAIAVAVFVVINVLYVRSKMVSAQRAMKMSNDLGAHLGLIISALRGTKTYPWPGVSYELPAAHLTPWAYVALALALGAAGTVATRTWYSRMRGRAADIGRSWARTEFSSSGG